MLGKIEMKGGFQVLTFMHASAPAGVINVKPMSMKQFQTIFKRALAFGVLSICKIHTFTIF